MHLPFKVVKHSFLTLGTKVVDHRDAELVEHRRDNLATDEADQVGLGDNGEAHDGRPFGTKSRRLKSGVLGFSIARHFRKTSSGRKVMHEGR